MEFHELINADMLLYPRLAMAFFFAILFIQSGLDKVMNFQENVSWLYSHFSETFLSSVVPFIFILLTISEMAAGVLSAFGILYLLFTGITIVAWYGMAFSTLSFLFLFFGQRMAKDYAGAGALVPYFITAIVGMLLLS